MARGTSKIPRRLWVLGGLLIVIIISAIVGVRYVYNQNLGPISDSQEQQIVTIASGSSVKEISKLLADQKLIRSPWVFEWYVHSKELGNKLQAGTYSLSPSTSLPEIANTLTKGKVTTSLVTILPGRRIDQVRADLINKGFTPAAVDAALMPDQYRDLPVMSFVPAGTETLEGLLFPDSFQRIETTDPSSIIRQSLQAMGNQLPPSRQAAYASRNLTVFEAIIMASIIEQEAANQTDRDQVAQVFLSRLKLGMSLGSDPTAFYGAIKDGKEQSVNYKSAYNTRLNKGLPIGPISTVSESSLKALANPANTEWLYFVAGDDGTTYFQTTYEQHQSDTAKYCTKLCQ